MSNFSRYFSVFLSNKFMGLVRSDLDFSYGLAPKYLLKQIYRSASMPQNELETYIMKRITCVHGRTLFRELKFTLV